MPVMLRSFRQLILRMPPSKKQIVDQHSQSDNHLSSILATKHVSDHCCVKEVEDGTSTKYFTLIDSHTWCDPSVYSVVGVVEHARLSGGRISHGIGRGQDIIISGYGSRAFENALGGLDKVAELFRQYFGFDAHILVDQRRPFGFSSLYASSLSEDCNKVICFDQQGSICECSSIEVDDIVDIHIMFTAVHLRDRVFALRTVLKSVQVILPAKSHKRRHTPSLGGPKVSRPVPSLQTVLRRENNTLAYQLPQRFRAEGRTYSSDM